MNDPRPIFPPLEPLNGTKQLNSNTNIPVSQQIDNSISVNIVAGSIQQPNPSSSSLTSDATLLNSLDLPDAKRTDKKRKRIDYATWQRTRHPDHQFNDALHKLVVWSQKGQHLNERLRTLREYQNPKILKDMIDMCGIDEYGTNTKGFGISSFRVTDNIVDIAKAQEAEQAAKSEYQRSGKRMQVDFVKQVSGRYSQQQHSSSNRSKA